MFIQMKRVIEEHPFDKQRVKERERERLQWRLDNLSPVSGCPLSRVIKLRCTDNAELPSKHATCVILIPLSAHISFQHSII